ncbi:MAG: TonB-dependent receptor plug domain-containing protein [Oleispira sp.]|nr:TonB-dependent receptor plug domain-containing protein [Oleispira sp.]
MPRRSALLKIRNLTQFFQFPSRLVCIGAFLLAQSFAWAETEKSDTSDETNEFETKELETIVIVGVIDEAMVLEQSAAAVDVIDLKADQKLTADLSEVLSREPGISIRRMGGLGSRETFSLNGLKDEQIRFFIDGIPLEMSAYTFGIGSIPVNLVRRADIYHGVVPIELGADALGGAVNFITDNGQEGTGGSISHMIGDFNTTRSTLSLNYAGDSGFFSRLNGFYDYSDNNYEVDVTLPNELGKKEPYKAERFHDAYEGQGANVDFGYTEQSWADLFQVSLYTSEYYKEIQHNVTMSKPYGEATIERKTYGLNLRYKKQLTDELSLSATAGASEMKSHFFDIGDYSYLWNGEQVITPAPHPGEIGDACDCTYLRNSEYAIVHLGWKLAEDHSLDFSTSPTWHRQSSKNDYLTDDQIDPVDADRNMFSLVSGVNYTFDFFDDKLQNKLFVKHYSQDRESVQLNGTTRLEENIDSNIDRMGWGNVVRYKFYQWLIAKASYEQATRLPSFDEVFGDSESVIANIELNEEYSNNYNLSLEINELTNDYGSWKGGASYFIRDVEDAIILMTVNDLSQYQNVSSVDSRGFQVSGSWNSAEDFLTIKANYTNFDLINTADEGLFAQFKNQQIPNSPHTFFNTMVGLKWMSVFAGYDELRLNWNYRFVDRYELLWEDYGLSQFNPYVPAQESHSLATIYTKDIYSSTVSVAAEVQNITDEKLYDHYGVQRPGRAFNLKTVIEF